MLQHYFVIINHKGIEQDENWGNPHLTLKKFY